MYGENSKPQPAEVSSAAGIPFFRAVTERADSRNAIPDIGGGHLSRAICATEKPALYLYAMSNHLAPAVFADWSHLVNRALEAVEDVTGSRGLYGEGLVIVVAANLTLCH
jgi:hypothetical protein